MPNNFELRVGFLFGECVILFPHEAANVPAQDHLLLGVSEPEELLDCELRLVPELSDQQLEDALHKALVRFGAQVEPIVGHKGSHICGELQQSEVNEWKVRWRQALH